MSLQRHKVAAIAVALMATPLLEATSNHTWVATNGSDGNPCTQSQPCLTFQTAVAVTTAGGILSVLSPGDFGPVTISHTITIDGGANGGTITFTGSQGINVSAAASDTVILRHLVVNGLNTGTDGILLAQAQHVTIEDCKIEGFTEYGLRVNSATNPISVAVKNTTITGGQVGIRTLQVNNNVPLYLVSLRNIVISGASVAAVFSRNGQMEISDSLLTESTIGVEADSNAFINVANSVISFNGTDEEFFPLATGGILVSNNCTLFGNNGLPGPPGGPNALVNPKAALPSTHAPPLADTPRQRR
jgi:hypothetical protein